MFVPDPIADFRPAVSLDLAQGLSEAEAALARQGAHVEASALRSLTPLLARQESIASSWIEGLEVGHRRLARAALSPDERDPTARSVLGNVEALRTAMRAGRQPHLDLEQILDVHRALMVMAPAPWPDTAGRLRDGIIWIGRPGSTPLSAEHVAAPPEQVPELMEDLVRWMNRDDVPAILQAAVAHAQFETIHPFADGNGRVGRCLIHTQLARAGFHHVVFPVSAALAADREGYIQGLKAYQQGDLVAWTVTFVAAVNQACEDVAWVGGEIGGIRSAWENQLRERNTRRDAADWRLIDVLLATPVVDAAAVAESLVVSRTTATAALERLEGLGIVRRGERRWGREWTAAAVIQLMIEADARLRSRRLG